MWHWWSRFKDQVLFGILIWGLTQLSWLIIVLASRLHARNFNGVSMLCTDPRTIPYNAHHLCTSFGLGQRVCGRLDLILSWNGNYWCATEEYISWPRDGIWRILVLICTWIFFYFVVQLKIWDYLLCVSLINKEMDYR